MLFLMEHLNLQIFMKRVITLSLVATVLVFSACKSNSKKEESSENENATSAKTSPAPAKNRNQLRPINPKNTR